MKPSITLSISLFLTCFAGCMESTLELDISEELDTSDTSLVGALASSTCQTTSWDAKTQMTASAGGPAREAWNLWSNGTLSTTHAFVGGEHIEVRARGDHGQGWPEMSVEIDGQTLGMQSVNTADFRTYTFTAPLSISGSRRLVVRFANDALGPGYDRNLLVSGVKASCATSSTATGSHTGALPATHMELKDSQSNVVCSAYHTPANAPPLATGCPSGTYNEHLFDAKWRKIGTIHAVTIATDEAEDDPQEDMQLHGDISADVLSPSTVQVTVKLDKNAPCQIFYRRLGQTQWTAREPAETSSLYGTGLGHRQVVSGLSPGVWQFYAKDAVANSYQTETIELEVAPSLWTTIQDADWRSTNPESHADYRASWANADFTPDGNATDAWRVTVSQGESYGAAEKVDLPGRPKEVWMRYRVLLPTTSIQAWRTSDDPIKMPGLAGDVSSDHGGHGGSKLSNRPHALRAWSARQMLGRPTDYVYGMELYWQGSTNQQMDKNGRVHEYGDAEWYSSNGLHSGGLALKPGRWSEVEVRVRMNDPGQSNGSIRTFLDGVPGYSKTNFAWTLADDMLVVRRVWFNVYHGGSAKKSSGDLSLYFRDFAYRIVE